MAEITMYMFGLKEVVELLIKQQGIHEGVWGISIEFGLSAANVPITPDGSTVAPAAITIIQKIGIRRAESPNNLTIDAAEVNPLRAVTDKNRRAVGLKKVSTKRAKNRVVKSNNGESTG